MTTDTSAAPPAPASQPAGTPAAPAAPPAGSVATPAPAPAPAAPATPPAATPPAAPALPATAEELAARIDAEVTARFDQVFAQRRSRWEAEVAAWLDAEAAKAAPPAPPAPPATPEPAKAEPAEPAKPAGPAAELVEARIELAAITAGVKADRAGLFAKLVDRAATLTDDGAAIDAERLTAAVAAALDLAPEFRTAAPGASGADFRGADPARRAATLEEAVTAALSG